MISSSEEFRRAIAYSHQAVFKCSVFGSNQILLDSLAIEDGNVRVDANNKYRRTCDVTLRDYTGDLSPKDANALLAPYGNELLLYRGMILPRSQTVELIQLGAFVITSAEVGDSGETVSIGIKGVDRGIRISRARLSKPYVVANNTNTGQAIHDLLQSRWGALQFARDFSQVISTTLPNVALETEADPWDAAIKWAKDSGYSLFLDNTGKADVRKLPEGDEDLLQPSLFFVEGSTSSLLSIRNDIDVEQTYSHVVVVGEPANQSPVWAEAKDNDPTSPTFVGGDFGDVTYFYRSPLIHTTEQAQSVANSMMQKHKGHSQHVHFNAIPDPCADVDDIVQVKRDRIGVNANFQLDNLTIPIVATRAMECDTRHKYVNE